MMAVYVDKMRARFGRLVMCHMVADSHEELIAMVDAIGVDRRWIQDAGTYREHFDIGLTKRAAALRRGAVLVTLKQLALKVRTKRQVTAVGNGNG